MLSSPIFTDVILAKPESPYFFELHTTVKLPVFSDLIRGGSC